MRQPPSPRPLPNVAAAVALCAALTACGDAVPTTARHEPPAPTEGPATSADSLVRGFGLPPAAPDTAARLVGDTAVRAGVSTRPPELLSGSGTVVPNRIDVVVTATDSLARAVALAYAECPLVLRLFRSPDRSARPVWSTDRAAPDVACPPLSRPRPGELGATWPVPALLGDSLPAGRYWFGLGVRHASGRLLDFGSGSAYLTADVAAPGTSPDSARLSATSRVLDDAPRTLETVVWLRNPTTRFLALTTAQCLPRVRLVTAGAAPGATPVWRSEQRRSVPGGFLYACAPADRTVTIAPGDSTALSLTVPLVEVLGDSLAAGRYGVVAEVELRHPAPPGTPSVPAIIAVAAGQVELTRAPDRLPAARTLNGLRVTASTRVRLGGLPNGDTLRTVLVVTNTTTAPMEAVTFRDCPVATSVYASAALRDSLPTPGPLWRSLLTCGATTVRFSLAPGASWAFQADVPLREVRAFTGPGRRWFTARLVGLPDVTVASGDGIFP